MAKQIQAIGKYIPKIKLGATVQLKDIVEYISDRTGLNKGDLQIALSELSSAVMFFNKRGQSVKLEGLGTYQPKINLSGKFSIYHRLDKDISNALNTPGAFSGEITNNANIGKTTEDLVAMWNEENPQDPVS